MSIRLTNPVEDRYQRFRLIRWWDQEKLRNGKALIVGAGALGNEVAKNLALLGVGNVWVADFDKIETSNLTRSVLFRPGDVGAWKAEVLAGRASEINPDCIFHPLNLDVRYDLGLQFFGQLDLVFGCLDNREARYYINRNCYLTKKIFIDGGLDTLNGSVTVFTPPETACYECTLNATDRVELQKRISCLKSTTPEIKHHVPTAPTIASIIGGLQTQIGTRALHGLEIPAGKRIGLYGLSDVFFEMKLEISEDCGLHSAVDTLPDSIESLQASDTESLSEILSKAKQKWNAESLSWDFDRDLITALTCTSCSRHQDFVGTSANYSGSDTCACGGLFKPTLTSGYSGAEDWGQKSLRQLGFPKDHIYCAKAAADRIYFTVD
jgi:adenylyltransferase/sulfurtransferase